MPQHSSNEGLETSEWKTNVGKLNSELPQGLEGKPATLSQSEPTSTTSNFLKSPYQSILELHEHFEDKDDPTKLSVMHINIRSLTKHIDRLKTNLCLMERMPDIICICETKIPEKKNKSETYIIPNYAFMAKCRDTGYGGVAMYINENYIFRHPIEFEFKEGVFEPLVVELETQSAFPFICGVIYHSSANQTKEDVESFFDLLNNCLEKIKQKEMLAVICGDFNFDLSVSETNPNKFKKIMHENNFVPCINRPTRYPTSDSQKPRLLDIIWVNDSRRVSKAAILVDPFMSDHLAVSCSLNVCQYILPHIFDKSNKKQFWNVLSNLSDQESEVNPNESLALIKHNLTEAVKTLQLITGCISWKSKLGPNNFDSLKTTHEVNLRFQTNLLLSSLKCWINTEEELNSEVQKMLKNLNKDRVKADKQKAFNKTRRNCLNSLLSRHFVPFPYVDIKLVNQSNTRFFEFSQFRWLFKTSFGSYEISENKIKQNFCKYGFPFPIEFFIFLGKNLRNKIFNEIESIFNQVLQDGNVENLLKLLVSEIVSPHGNEEYKLNFLPILQCCIHEVNFRFRNCLNRHDIRQFGYQPNAISRKLDCEVKATVKIVCELKAEKLIQVIFFDFSNAFDDIIYKANESVQNIANFFPLSEAHQEPFTTFECFSNYLKILKNVSEKTPKNYSVVEQLFLRKVIDGMYREISSFIAFEHEHILIVSNQDLSALKNETQEQLNKLNTWLEDNVNLQRKPQNIKCMLLSQNSDATNAQEYTFAENVIENCTEMSFLGKELHNL